MPTRLPLQIAPAWVLLGLGCAATASNNAAFSDGGVMDTPIPGDMINGSDAPAADVARPVVDAGRRRTTLDVNHDGFADVIVGASESDTAYVYLGSTSGLATTPTTLTSPSRDVRFGYTVSRAGDVNDDGFDDVLVGAPLANATYLYLGSPAGLTVTHAAVLGTGSSDGIGRSGTSAGDVNGDGFDDVIAGAYYANAAALYLGSANGLFTPPRILVGPDESLRFGWSVASAGDLNADGFADVIVGATLSSTAYFYLGSETGIVATPARLAVPPIALFAPDEISGFGYSVTGAGDVNGDGFDDVLVAASLVGTAYLYLNSATGLSSTPTPLTTPGGAPYHLYSVASAGDINGDGFDDFLAGAPVSNATYLYLGSASGTVPTPITLIGPRGSRGFGSSIASPGDVNGDGFDDVLVGASASNSAYLYLGGPTGLASVPTTLIGPDGSSDFGRSVAAVATPAEPARTAG